MSIEKLTTLAFSMYSNKGAYALLLGSGISRSANIPSGWEVEKILIKKLANLRGVRDADNWHKWYKENYNNEANYSSLLGEIVKTPTERVHLMSTFFEPTNEEKELGKKVPTKAHIAIAKLAKEGYIRIILTTNFDRLLEKAFESEGVIPQIISHESGILQATPIVHSKKPTIIKVNGDYIDCKFRNTTEELDEYPEQMRFYLQRIFEDYGLLTCGWSGDWDKGLIKIINGAAHSRYNSFFASVGDAKDTLMELSKNRAGEIMPIKDADYLFSELYEQVMALEKFDAKSNMSQHIIKERVKKYLSAKEYNIHFADIIEKCGTDAYNQIMEVAHYNFILNKDYFERYYGIHLCAVKPLIEAAILSVRWGKEWHIKLLGDILIKLCTKPIINGEQFIEHTQYLHSLAPMLLFNTIGIACVKYERFRELNDILKLSVPAGNFMGFTRESLLSMLGGNLWNKDDLNNYLGNNYIYPLSLFLLKNLTPFFKDYFVTESEYNNAFYIWEHLKSLLYGYNKCYPHVLGFSVPIGNFLYQGLESERHKEKEPYTLFFEQADKLMNSWGPIKQGMFDGDYNNYKQTYKQAKDFYSKHICF